MNVKRTRTVTWPPQVFDQLLLPVIVRHPQQSLLCQIQVLIPSFHKQGNQKQEVKMTGEQMLLHPQQQFGAVALCALLLSLLQQNNEINLQGVFIG